MNLLLMAIQFIRYDKTKSVGILAGIIISTFLIGQQLGIFTFLTGLMASIVDNSNAQIWVIDAQSTDVNQLGTIDIRSLYEVKSLPGIKEAYPVVFVNAIARIPNGNSVNVVLIGSEAPTFIMGPNLDKIVQGNLIDLLNDGAVSADIFDNPLFGVDTKPGVFFEIDGKEAHIALQTRNLRGFGASQLFTTLDRARFFGDQPSSKINAILVNTTDAYRVDQVIEQINKQFPLLRAWKKEELTRSTILKILSSSGIASSTGTLIIFALISGILIIGLTMYSSVLDRIKDYGTMKAIGINNAFLAKLLLCQATIYAITGFLIAWSLLEIFRLGVVNTGLLITYSLYEISGIFLITALISACGMLFALFRLRNVEPASVFRT